MSTVKKAATAEEIDEAFDRGEDMSQYFDFTKFEAVPPLIVRFSHTTLTKKVNLDLPIEVVEALDAQSKRMGITRQSLMKTWLWDRLKQEGLIGDYVGYYMDHKTGEKLPATAETEKYVDRLEAEARAEKAAEEAANQA